MLTQRRWRLFGVIALAGSAVMAVFGVDLPLLRTSGIYFIGYWGFFLILLLLAVYCALLDLRYIRVQQAVAERELYRELLADEALRKSLRAGAKKDDSN